MDADWDADNYEPVLPKAPVNKWEGEDEEEEVKDSWEDEDNEEEKKDSEKPPEPQKSAASKKPKKNLQEKIEEKEKKLQEELARKEEAKKALRNLSPAELQAEKLRQRKLQEEAELEIVKATYGVEDAPQGIDSANPSSKEDFDKLREAINSKVQDFSKSEHFLEFVTDLVQNMCVNLPSAEIKKLSTSLTALANEKSKMDKAATASKKKGGKFKAQLKLDDKDLTSEFSEYGGDYDDFI